MSGMEKAYAEARKLYLNHNAGILSTISVEIPGYPFGSLTPYAPDSQFRPILLLSDIAEHTQNILGDARVSLTIAQTSTGEVQAQGRVTIVSDARLLEGTDSDEVAERYFSFFPYARGYTQAHKFSFYRLEPRKIRYIGGFGKIFWVPLETFVTPNPFSPTDQEAIIGHMNADHEAALRHYVALYKKMDVANDEEVRMVSIDQDGCDLLLVKNRHNLRIDFETPVATRDEAREILTKMARARSA